MAMKLRTLALGFAVGALLTAGLALGVTEASASGPNVTYYACLKNGKLTRVGTATPTCSALATKISWNSQGPAGTPGTNGTNGTNFLTSPSAPSGVCNNGDTDLALDSDEFWSCSGGTWTDSGSNIKPTTYNWAPTVGGTPFTNFLTSNTTIPAGSTVTLVSGSLTAPFGNCPDGVGAALFSDASENELIATWEAQGNATGLAPDGSSPVTFTAPSALLVSAQCAGNSAPLGGEGSFNLTFTVTPPLPQPYS
jgi:hypothetical protein